MPPSAENSVMTGSNPVEEHVMHPQQDLNAQSPDVPVKNVTFAVNYELPMVAQFLCVTRKRRRKRRQSTPVEEEEGEGEEDVEVEDTANSGEEQQLSASEDAATTTTPVSRRGTRTTTTTNLENDAPAPAGSTSNNNLEVVPEENNPQEGGRAVTNQSPPPLPSVPSPTPSSSSTPLQRRMSMRDKQKRDIPLARNRVRYDMQLVPIVQRNQAFLDSFDTWWNHHVPNKKQRRSSRSIVAGHSDDGAVVVNNSIFAEGTTNNSVIWIPTKRTEWEDTISEMTAVCTQAAIRMYHRNSELQQQQHKKKKKPFIPPLSREYIRDRIDIDDPLLGYQLRHRFGGWLQGFILFTNFTTWTHGFHWDSRHPASGFGKLTKKSCPYADHDGQLAVELEAQSRSGDPRGGGIVFPALAEIALLGGLGCGEYLLRMALNKIREDRNYKYVVLQATDQSKTFYERFGFVRVGAVCQYGLPLPGSAKATTVGYRHWTHAHESEQSLQAHGGPSYMMCLKLPEDNHDDTVEENKSNDGTLSFIDHMMTLQVPVKPTIEQIGASSTPGLKFARRSSSMPIEFSTIGSGNSSPRGNSSNAAAAAAKVAPTSNNSNNKKKTPGKVGRPRKRPVTSPTPQQQQQQRETASGRLVKPPQLLTAAAPSPSLQRNVAVRVAKVPKRAFSSNDLQKANKRQKISATSTATQSPIPPPPPDGRPFTFAEKQYHHKWLAVPPKLEGTMSPRPPPKERTPLPAKGKDAVSEAKKKKDKVAVSEAEKKKPRSAPVAKAKRTRRASLPTPSPRSRNRSSQKKKPASTSKSDSGRIYHSVRGPDGKFVRVEIFGSAASSSPTFGTPSTSDTKKRLSDRVTSKNTSSAPTRSASAKKKAPPKSKKKTTPITSLPDPEPTEVERAPMLIENYKRGKVAAIDKKTMMKQKVKSYPRNREHYYNRVVRPKGRKPTDFSNVYFVLEFDEVKNLICIVPMVPRGTLLGRREGRPRYQCELGDTNANFQVVDASRYDIVRSAMVMKTPIIFAEAWDLELPTDTNFQTR